MLHQRDNKAAKEAGSTALTEREGKAVFATGNERDGRYHGRREAVL